VPIRYIESVQTLEPAEVVPDERDDEEGAEVPEDAVGVEVE
jgi:hypothetical protein